MALIGDILIKEGKVTQQQLELALREQKRTRELLGAVLIRLGMVSEKTMSRIMADSSDIAFVDVAHTQIDPAAVNLVDGDLARRFIFMPISFVNNTLQLAMDNPNDVTAIDTVSRTTGVDIEAFAADRNEILETIDVYYDIAETLEKEIDDLIASASGGAGLGEAALEAPVTKLVDLFIFKGLRKSATDIHISSEEKSIRISYRIDGILQSDTILPLALHSALITRIKIQSGMNIAEQRLPQEGGMSFDFLGRTVDIRVASAPSINGENMALRLLDRGNVALELDRIGLSPEEQVQIRRLSLIPYGMVLMAGPTGAGKTTTLYSMLKQINALEKNVLTIEDPVEYELPTIKQTQLNITAGLTFEKAIRHFLRQDPDILLVGEIRDLETARTAFQAAMTGHLVLSTVHTNNATATIPRLMDLGIERYYIASTVRAVVAQRLVRRLCNACKEAYGPAIEETAADYHKEIGLYGLPDWNKEGTTLYRAKGCDKCNHTGYMGRTGIFEIFEVSPEISRALAGEFNSESLEEIAVSQGMTTLRDAGLGKVLAGVTSLEEVIRVTL